MKRNIALIVSLVLLIIITASVFILQGNYLPDKIEQRITPLVEEAIGRRIKYSGSYINTFPFYWQLYKTSLTDPKTGDILLTASSIRVSMSLRSLLLGEILIRDINFIEPKLSVIRYSDGKTNLDGLFPDNKPTKWKVMINRISISKGYIQINDLQSNKNVTFSNVDCRILPDLAGKKFKGSVIADGSYSDAKLTRRGLKIKGDVAVDIKDKKPGTVKVTGLNITTPEGSILKVDGKADGNGMIDLTGTLAVSLTDLSDFTGTKKDLQGNIIFTGSVKGFLSTPVVKGSITAENLIYQSIKYGKLKGELSYKERLLDLSRLKGEILNGPVNGNIEIDFRGDIPSYHVHLKVDNAQPHRAIARYMPDSKLPLDKKGVLSSEAELWGTGFDKETLEGKGWISYKDSQQSISLSGVINKGLDLNAGITGETADIADYLHIPHFPLHGNATITGEVSGPVYKPVISGAVVMNRGVVKDTVFDSVTAGLRFSDGELLLQPVVLRRNDSFYSLYGSIKFRAAGFKDPYFALKGDINHGVPNDFVSIFHENLPMDMKVDGRVSLGGDSDSFQWTFVLKSSSGALYSQGFDSSEIVFNITKERVIFDSVKLRRGNDIAEGKGWVGFAGEYKGEFHTDMSSGQFSIENIDLLNRKYSLFKGSGKFSLSAGGKFSNPAADITIQIPHLFIKDVDTGFAMLSLSKETGDVHVAGQAVNMHYEGDIAWDDDLPFKVSVHSYDSSINPLLNFINPSLSKELSVKASGETVIEGKLKNPDTFRVSVVLSRLSGIYGEYTVENDGDIKLVYENNRVSLESVRLKGEGTSFNITGSLFRNGDNNIYINGEIDLRLLSLLTPEIKYSKGNAFLAFLITGELANPYIQGGLAIKNGTIRSASLRQTLENVNISIFFNGREIILETMNGNVGGGTVTGYGKLEMGELDIKEFGFVLEIADAVFRYPEGVESRLDGTFVFQGARGSKELKGEINIRKASYDKNINVRTMILDFQKKKIKIEQPVPLLGNTDLNIHIGGKKNIWINNNVAKVPLDIDLMLKGTVDHPLLFGRVEAHDGTFYFSRNIFTILSATADFISNDTIKPVLDIHAVTDIREYKIDLRLTGTMDRFYLTLSSDPTLSETDILALLTVGQTAAEVEDTMKSIGAIEATAFLAAPIQEKLEGTLQDIIKVDRFQVEPYYSNTSASGGARLTVGKKLLDDRLYVTYTTGITTLEELIKLEYFLGKNVYVVGKRDEQGRMSSDIKFRFEFK